MKRHKSLYPLSHDHHHVLVHAKHLRIASTSSDISSLLQSASNFITFWEGNLQTHFRQEEEILLPVFTQYSSSDRETSEILEQHAQIQQVVNQMRQNIVHEIALSSTSQQLSELLSKHIRYEEQLLFPAIQKIVPEDVLWEIHRQLSRNNNAS